MPRSVPNRRFNANAKQGGTPRFTNQEPVFRMPRYPDQNDTRCGNCERNKRVCRGGNQELGIKCQPCEKGNLRTCEIAGMTSRGPPTNRPPCGTCAAVDKLCYGGNATKGEKCRWCAASNSWCSIAGQYDPHSATMGPGSATSSIEPAMAPGSRLADASAIPPSPRNYDGPGAPPRWPSEFATPAPASATGYDTPYASARQPTPGNYEDPGAPPRWSSEFATPAPASATRYTTPYASARQPTPGNYEDPGAPPRWPSEFATPAPVSATPLNPPPGSFTPRASTRESTPWNYSDPGAPPRMPSEFMTPAPYIASRGATLENAYGQDTRPAWASQNLSTPAPSSASAHVYNDPRNPQIQDSTTRAPTFSPSVSLHPNPGAHPDYPLGDYQLPEFDDETATTTQSSYGGLPRR